MDEVEGVNLFEEAEGGPAALVEATGLAVVHEGELVLPASGSEAAARIVAGDQRTTVNYWFPVEVEIRGNTEPLDLHQWIEQALRKAASAFEKA